MKCKFCDHWGSIDIIPKSLNSMKSDQNEFQPLVAVEARGWEPLSWIPTDGFCGVGIKGTKFNDIDLSDEWVDYDETAAESVEVFNMKSTVEKLKQ
jgi:hypothetical protein